MSNKLKQITTKAKQLYKSGKFAKWTDAIKAASKSITSTTKKVGAVKKKAAKKKAAPKKVTVKRKSTPGKHKDTNSHNVKIHVVSGKQKNSSYAIYNNVPAEIQKAKDCITYAENNIIRLKSFGNSPTAKKSVKMWKDYIKEYKTHITQLKKYI